MLALACEIDFRLWFLDFANDESDFSTLTPTAQLFSFSVIPNIFNKYLRIFNSRLNSSTSKNEKYLFFLNHWLSL